MTSAIAYCWASGEIEIAKEIEDFELPEGTIIMARGELGELTQRIDFGARHGYETGVRLVPGLPEICGSSALDDLERVQVLTSWTSWAFADWPADRDGIHTQPAQVLE